MKENNKLNGKWEWAELTPYEDEKGEKKAKESIKVLINASSFKEEYKLKYEENVQNNGTNSESKFIGVEPQEMEIAILLDATGIFDSGFGQSMMKSINSFNPKKETASVNEQVKKLKETFLQVYPSSHKPLILGFNWGKFDYKCTVQSLLVEHKLFNKNGETLRAELKLNTKKIMDPILVNSPDLTHVRTVKSSDNWQLLVDEIYQDPRYYWEAAKANQLINFRNLKPGMQVFFPPLNK